MKTNLTIVTLLFVASIGINIFLSNSLNRATKSNKEPCIHLDNNYIYQVEEDEEIIAYPKEKWGIKRTQLIDTNNKKAWQVLRLKGGFYKDGVDTLNLIF